MSKSQIIIMLALVVLMPACATSPRGRRPVKAAAGVDQLPANGADGFGNDIQGHM